MCIIYLQTKPSNFNLYIKNQTKPNNFNLYIKKQNFCLNALQIKTCYKRIKSTR